MCEAEDYISLMEPQILKNKLQIQKLHPDAKIPTRATAGSAGYDLYALEDGEIQVGQHKLVSTGIAITVPEGCYGRIAPRSGLAVKEGIDVMAGVIDRDYTKEVKVVLCNLNLNNPNPDNNTCIFEATKKYFSYHYKKGDRIAQLIIEVIKVPDIIEVPELVSTDRLDGFGSTGV